MELSSKIVLASAFAIASSSLSVLGQNNPAGHFDLSNQMYKIDSPSVFHNQKSRDIKRINSLIDAKNEARRAVSFQNPEPEKTFPASDITGNIDAPNGELWYYTGEFVYEEIPPHDNVIYTERILQEYTFHIYDAQMNEIGVIKDKMNYAENEVRVPLCEITPVATRNFFNTDDNVEIMVALAVNLEEGGNNYRTLVYTLDGTTDAEGYNKPVTVLDDFVGDVVEGPSTDGSDNFYITFTSDVYDEPAGDGFWDYLLAQKAGINIYGKALDDKGPRKIFEKVIPLIQLPGDQESVPMLISMRRGDDVIFCMSEYELPFYNEYNDPFTEDMTQREGNSLVINLYKANEEGLDLFSTTRIPVVLDVMPDDSGNPTCLFSFYSVGGLNYSKDILFDAPGASTEKPDFVITRGNYQVSTDDITNSYFTYTSDGTLKNTLFLYADGTFAMGDIPGCEPQQMFVSLDAYGYMYNFVDLYSAKTVTRIDANYYTDDDAEAELLSSNVARTPVGDSYRYVFELRYPMVDDYDNDVLRFMYIDTDGKYDHTEYVNMGHGVAYAQSYLSTDALAPHAYSTSDTPAFMLLVKRGIDGAQGTVEELMVAEATSEDNPEGKTLLLLGANDSGVLASIVPDFAKENVDGRLFVYYYDYDTSKYTLDIYGLPLDKSTTGINGVGSDASQLTVAGSSILAKGDIKVYGVDGRLVAAGSGSVEFASLPSGFYIVSADGKSFKIKK